MNIDRKLNQLATVWQNPVDDNWGNFTFDDPKTIPVRWEDKSVLFLDRATGSEIVSQAVIWCLPGAGLKEQEMIALGDHTDVNNPYTAGAHTVKNVENTPNVRGTVVVTKVMV